MKRFKVINSNIGTIEVQCPSCIEIFRLNTRFVEQHSELIYRYTCPYCGKEHTLENN